MKLMKSHQNLQVLETALLKKSYSLFNWYGGGVGRAVEENVNFFSIVQMCQLPSVMAC